MTNGRAKGRAWAFWGVRVPGSLDAAVRQAAVARKCSLSDLLRVALTKYLRELAKDREVAA